MGGLQNPEGYGQAGGISRRTFLKVGASALAFAIVGRSRALEAHTPAGWEGLQFFNPYEGRMVEAFASRIWPGGDGDPGAREAGAVYYLDRALLGAYAEHGETYRRGLEALDSFAHEKFGHPFADLSEDQQDEILRDLEGGRASGFSSPSAPEFFALLRTHTLEGVFSDPIYGGNRDFAGWRVVNYPGAYYVYTEAEQQTFAVLNKPFQSVADL